MVSSRFTSLCLAGVFIIGTSLSSVTHAMSLSNEAMALQARNILNTVKANVTKYNLTSSEKNQYYRNIITIYKLVIVSLEKDLGIVTNTGGTTQTGATTGPITCTGVYPASDPNAVNFANGGFVIGGSISDQTNRVWKYNYKGTCTFSCLDGYTYNNLINRCEKIPTVTYAWSCGAVFGGMTPPAASQCNANTVGNTVAVSGAPNGCTCTATTTGGAGTTPGTNPGTGTNPIDVVCGGSVPTSNVIATANSTFAMVGFDSTNRTWKYDYNGTCNWKCATGYVVNSTKIACTRPPAGSGLSITVTSVTGAPLTGVQISATDFPMYGGSVAGSTDGNGRVELFPENYHNYNPNDVLVTLEKDGYEIASAVGCNARATLQTTLVQKVNSYCDGAPQTGNVTITMKPTPSGGVSNFRFVPLNGTMSMAAKNTLTTQLSGIAKSDTLACYEVVSHPNVPSAVNAGYCSNAASYSAFSGNNDWTWNEVNGGTWYANIKYDAPVYGAAGIKVRMYIKKKSTGEVASYEMAVTQ